jgi:putative endonuclease
LEAVDERKIGRIRRLAAQWLDAHDVHPGGVRIDLVGVVRSGRGPAEVVHVTGVG